MQSLDCDWWVLLLQGIIHIANIMVSIYLSGLLKMVRQKKDGVTRPFLWFSSSNIRSRS